MDTTDASAHSTDGTLDEALQRLHTHGPEFHGYLSNHGPMAVEALVRHGRADSVHRWLDAYETQLEDRPRADSAVTDANWREALGDPRRVTDWTAYMGRQLDDRPWREVLAEWWPRLLPGIAGAATHPVIRVGHAVRTLTEDGEEEPRVAELAHALGYWAARHLPLGDVPAPAGQDGPETALWEVPPVPEQEGGIRERLAQLAATPGWPAAAAALRPAAGPADARALLAEVVAAATARYAVDAAAAPVMLVHAATAPNAVLRTLPALPEHLWVSSLHAAWAASAAVTAAYAPRRTGRPQGPRNAAHSASAETPDRPRPDALADAFERAAAHGDAHAIKLTDTALDVAATTGRPEALRAAHQAVTLIPRER
ncbi:questin oxidase family protein [Streptomyces niger]|uniref:questin oxidase family protein n=1 Tax=Streptomyces niger TaxID=66373 RepID=UPI00069AC954|nr:questin oxidase family protein [Streptomyces niger]